MPQITVKSKGASFRRAGIAFTRDGVDVDTDSISKDRLDAIAADPQLVIVGELPEEDADAEAPKSRKKGASK